MSEKYIVTWDMLQIHARKLASRLMPSEQWKGIIAVSRGGLVPGALLARELGTPLSITMRTSACRTDAHSMRKPNATRNACFIISPLSGPMAHDNLAEC